MKDILTSGWNFMRVLRLLTGIAGLTYAIATKDYLLGAVGLLLIGLGIFNIGCCCSGACPVPKRKNGA